MGPDNRGSTVQYLHVLTTHFSATTSKKTAPTTRKVQAKTVMVTYVLQINKPIKLYSLELYFSKHEHCSL